jgi:hypothetical protein
MRSGSRCRPERAGLPEVHQFVDAREYRLAISGHDVPGDTLNEHLDLVVIRQGALAR